MLQVLFVIYVFQKKVREERERVIVAHYDVDLAFILVKVLPSFV